MTNNHITTALKIFIISQILPILSILIQKDWSTIDAYQAGVALDTVLVAIMFILYGSVVFEEWDPRSWPRIDGAQAKVIVVYSIIILLASQIVPGFLSLLVYLNPQLPSSFIGAYKFGLLVDLFVVFTSGYLYFNEKLKNMPTCF